MASLLTPPIKNVIVAAAVKLDIKDISNSSMHEELKEFYPKISPRKSGKIMLSDSGITTSREELDGYVFTSADNNKNAYIELRRIAFDNRNKYTNFDDFSKEYVNILKIMQKHINNFSISGLLALRYINEFSLSKKEKNLFKIALTSASDTQYFFDAYFRIKNTSKNINSFVQALCRENINNDSIQIIFDIDSRAKCNDMQNIMQDLTDLREEKNRIFFNNVDSALIERWK
ncbi:MAG: TIGR04255 family protein [Endomicrobium sp.]|jgi:uncharacterized protein (TIGR04255 family)|nr:TIGR04255 family protein [Endomicrobium sp.]